MERKVGALLAIQNFGFTYAETNIGCKCAQVENEYAIYDTYKIIFVILILTYFWVM